MSQKTSESCRMTIHYDNTLITVRLLKRRPGQEGPTEPLRELMGLTGQGSTRQLRRGRDEALERKRRLPPSSKLSTTQTLLRWLRKAACMNEDDRSEYDHRK